MSDVCSGDRVSLHFTARLATGAVFATSQGREPIQLVVGAEGTLKGLSQALLGMQVGDRKTVTLPPEQGFGQRHPELQHQVARAQLPDNVKVGDQLLAQAAAGEQSFPVWVRELDEDQAIVDGNHPLAGQTVTFDIELLAIQPEEEPT